MRLEKSEQLLKLALMMQASTEGVGLQEIQEEFEVGRRTAERMRDALLQLFPHVEEMRPDGKTKRWRLPASAMAGLIQISAEDLAEMKTAIDLLKKENLTQHAENLDRLWLKIKGRLRPESATRIETDLEALLEAEGHAMRPGPRPRINPHVLYILREAIKGFCKVKLPAYRRNCQTVQGHQRNGHRPARLRSTGNWPATLIWTILPTCPAPRRAISTCIRCRR